jgi:hypothetical protein
MDQKHRRQRDDDRLEPQKRNKEAVERADRHPNSDARSHRADLTRRRLLRHGRNHRVDKRDRRPG